jgi:hypothetical protein
MYKKVVLIISLPWKEKGSGLDIGHFPLNQPQYL